VNARHYEKYENDMNEMECNEYAWKNMKWDGIETIVNARHWENMNCMKWNVMQYEWDGIETIVNARHWEIWTVWNGM
jgi:hypothetical protein